MRKPGPRPRKAPKRGLTKTEEELVKRMAVEHAKRWQHLFSLNKWRPIK